MSMLPAGVDTYELLSGLRPEETFVQSMNRALDESLQDPDVVVGGQLVKYGVAGLTTGLYEKYRDQFITYSVSESLMNSSAMGLALAGKRVVMIHVRMDFLASGMCALVNHIPIWSAKGIKLPIVFICQIGKGMGQGPQHSKNLKTWFDHFEGWTTACPASPGQAYSMLKAAIFGDRPTMYVIHRELFNATGEHLLVTSQAIKLCGASQEHERKFYGD